METGEWTLLGRSATARQNETVIVCLLWLRGGVAVAIGAAAAAAAVALLNAKVLHNIYIDIVWDFRGFGTKSKCPNPHKKKYIEGKL